MSCEKDELKYHWATPSDLMRIQAFVHFWLSGRARAKKMAGAGNDYFVSRSQHRSYLSTAHVLVCIHNQQVIAWGVKGRNNVLIHLLVDGRYRGQGIGAEMLRRLNPDIIRSKSDQLTGDPGPFYEKHGYVHISSRRVGRKSNIDLLVKGGK